MKSSNKAAMTPAAFCRWMERYGLTLRTAGDRLGLSTRTVTQYRNGDCAISKVTAMAVWADEHGYPHSTQGRAKPVRYRADRPRKARTATVLRPVAPLPTWRSHRE